MSEPLVFDKEPQDGVPVADGEPSAFLAPTWYMDFGDPAVQDYAERNSGDAEDDLGKAVNLFYAIRDDFLYSPYSIPIDREEYKASALIGRGSGWCVQKSLAMVACCRHLGIPARVGYADVKNHLTTPKLRDAMGTDIFSYHGYADIWLEGQWVKATPVFNRTLCEKAKVKPQEFDGRGDALFQEYDAAGRRHMEYLRDRGIYSDIPFHEIMTDFAWRYPKYKEEQWNLGGADPESFAEDAAGHAQPETETDAGKAA